MATTNFKQWNNAAVNQETDSQYAVDSLRTGGAPVAGELPSPTFNKFAYQASTFYTAFAEMLANKGFSTNDADINVLSAVLANIITAADIPTPLVFVPYSPTPTLAAANVGGFFMSLSGNSAIQAVTGLTQGQMVAMYYLQDSTGGRVVTFPSTMPNATTPDPTPLAFSLQLFRYDGIGGSFLRPAGPLISNNGLFANGSGHFTGGVNAAGNGVIGGTLLVGGVATLNGPLTVNAPTNVTALLQSTNFFTPNNANVGTLQLGGAAPLGSVLVGDGTTYVPRNTTPRVAAGGGFFLKMADGTIEQWGHVGPFSGSLSSIAVSFPTAFTNLASVNIQIGLDQRSTTGSDSGAGVWATSATVNGFTAAAEIDLGAGSVGAYWRAIGF